MPIVDIETLKEEVNSALEAYNQETDATKKTDLGKKLKSLKLDIKNKKDEFAEEKRRIAFVDESNGIIKDKKVGDLESELAELRNKKDLNTLEIQRVQNEIDEVRAS